MRTAGFPRGVAWSLAIIAAALLLAWLVVASGAAASLRFNTPQAALKFMPNDARALADTAGATIEKATEDPRQRDVAEQLALRSIRIDPTLAAGYRVLGFIADAKGDHARALRLMRHAESLSRRDMWTELWLIERSIQDDDVPAALRHYDIALRTSLKAREILYPILANAVSEPALIEPLAGLLATPVPWRDDFVPKGIDLSEALPGLVALSDAMRAKGKPMTETEIRQLLYKLMAAQRIDLAVHVRDAHKLPGSDGKLVDPDFASTGPQMYPFSWTIATTDGVTAERAPAADGRPSRLEFQTDPLSSGEVARQLLLLRPGAYTFGYLGGSSAEQAAVQPLWEVQCLGSGGRIFTQKVAGSQAGAHGGGRFTVPASGCIAQWLILTTQSPSGSEPASGWVTGITVDPA